MVLPQDLISPNGPVEPDLFPGEVVGTNEDVLLTRLTSYIGAADSKTDGLGLTGTVLSDAVTAWALHLTFQAAFILQIARPADEDAQESILGRQQFDKDQRDALRIMSNDYRSQYDDIILNKVDTSAAATGLASFQSTNLYDW